MRLGALRAFAVFGVFSMPTSATAQTSGACGQEAFAAVVSESGGALSTMNEQKRRAFMEKLQALKAQEQWGDADYAAKAKTYVQDEKILAYDAKGKALLEKVQALGGGDALTDEKRCAMLADLKMLLGQVVANTREKWDYMFAKLSGALKPAVAAPATLKTPAATAKIDNAKPDNNAAPKPKPGGASAVAAKPQGSAQKTPASPAAPQPKPSQSPSTSAEGWAAQ